MCMNYKTFPKWDYIYTDNRENMIMSGWKLYIHGNTLHHSRILSNLLLDTVNKFNLTTKVANESIIKRNKKKKIAWSSMVIYLTDAIFRNNLFKTLIDDINKKLNKYNIQGVIPGARAINGKISYRYDITIPINHLTGIQYDDYVSLYRGEHGEYNIKGNIDIIKP